MAHFRSNSFPSQSHPIVNDVEFQICRLKSSQATSTSSTSICENLSSLTHLLECINNMIEMPLIQQGQRWINELLEGSLRLVDLCGFSREILCLTKESIQDLESSLRRNRFEDIKTYEASKKKINKMVKKGIKNFNQSFKEIPNDEFGTMLKETEELSFSVLSSVLLFITGEKEKSTQRNWSLLSKFTQANRVNSELVKIDVKQLKAIEMNFEELEEGLEALFRSLIKTRVSLLNVLSQ